MTRVDWQVHFEVIKNKLFMGENNLIDLEHGMRKSLY